MKSNNATRELLEKFFNLKGFEVDFKKHKNETIIRVSKGPYTYGDSGKTKLECLLKMLVWVERLGYE